VIAALSMRETADAVGLSYDRFRRVWPTLPGFPPPFRERTWAAEAVAAWIHARSHGPAPGCKPLPAAAPALQRIARERAQLEALRAA
jgi:hypothetical protein